MKTLILFAVLACAGCGTDLTCRTIHKPRAGCPEGWKLRPGLFTERNGSSEDACIAPDNVKVEECTDMLKGGESETIHIFGGKP